MARTMMRQKDVDQDLWADAIKTAVYIKNRVTSRALPVGKTPHELWTGNKPDVSHMRVFGSTCWVVLHKSHVDGQFGDKAAKGIGVSYSDGSQALKVILDDGNVVKARRVVFSQNNSRKVADVPKDSPVDDVVEGETGLDAGNDDQDIDGEDDQDVDAEDDGDDDHQQDDDLEKLADDNQGSSGSQYTLRRSGRSQRPPVEYWRPVSLVAHEASMTYGHAVQGQESTKWRAEVD